MTKTRRAAPLPPLHDAFVSAIRAAWKPVSLGLTSRRLPNLAGAIYWTTEDGRAYCPPQREMKRLRRLAVTLGYDGPILGEVVS